VFEGNEREKATQLISDAEVIFCLDFSVLNRIKEMENDVRKSTAAKVLIDHHQQPEDFADFVFWNEKAAATCELIYLMLEETLGTDALSADGATCLYAGLVTDTGSFRFSATTPDVHRVAGELIAKGVNNSLVHRKLFDTNAVDRLRFLGYALSQKLIHLPEYRVAYFSFTKEELAQFNSKNGDTEGIVNYGLSIAGVVMSAIFVERDDLVKISFRSVDNFSVSNFSRDNFEGGGHHNAAGGRSHQTIEKTVDKFLNLLPSQKADLLAQP
ncbi:MAG: phosphoesterase RecJ-like protein, partial [Spirosomataceae bacterium]